MKQYSKLPHFHIPGTVTGIYGYAGVACVVPPNKKSGAYTFYEKKTSSILLGFLW